MVKSMKPAQIVYNYNKSVLAEKKVNAALKAEEIRERIDSEGLVNQIYSLVDEVDQVLAMPLDRQLPAIAAIKLKHEILSGLLKKVVPDVRAVEVKSGQSDSSRLIIDMVS
jgi:hypothetical protein